MSALPLAAILSRAQPPEPWAEGDKIPWHDPAFSARMLREHLSQEHDAASRRSPIIDAHVRWIDETLLAGAPTRILDLGCGPGLYTRRLAGRGHHCAGIDFGPASIEYAREDARAHQLDATYDLADIRSAPYGSGYGLVMLLYGELNVFRPAEARRILERAREALDPGGLLLVEPSTYAGVRQIGQQPPSWASAAAGLFSAVPHILLHEAWWDEETRTATERWFVIDGATAAVARYAATTQAYTRAGYVGLLETCGFQPITFYASLGGLEPEPAQPFIAITARRPA